MAYTYETFIQAGIFVARVGGERHQLFEDNVSEAWEFWSSVALGMKRQGLHRLLAVISARGALRSLNVPTFYRRMGEMGFMANMRMAVVLEVPEHERPVLRLGIRAAAQDGWSIRQFLSESEALAWLCRTGHVS